MKRFVAILTLLAVILCLAGCFAEPEPTAPSTTPTTEPTTEPTTAPTEPELTAESVMAQVAEAINGRPVSQLDVAMTIDLGIKMEVEGFSMSMDMSMVTEMDMIVQDYPNHLYAEMAVQMEVMGQTQVQKADTYYLIEDGQVVCYLYDQMLDTWTYTEMGPAPDTDAPDDGAETPPVELTLDDATQKVDLREAYVLRGQLTREHLAQFITPMTGSMIMPLATDPSELPEELGAEAVIYVDTQTHLPLRIQMDVWGIEDMLDGLLPGSTDSPSVELSMTTVQTEESPYDISINTFRIEMDSFSFEPTEVPQVPQEAYAYVQMAAHDPDLGDGSYLIVHTGTAAKITPPEGWEIWDIGFSWLYVDHLTDPISASYTMLSGMSRQEMQKYVLQDSVTPMQQLGLLDSYAYGERIGKFDTMYAKMTSGATFYYAWAPMSDGWLLITVQDASDVDMYELLTPLVEAVEAHDPLH